MAEATERAATVTVPDCLLDAVGAVRVEKGTPTEEELAALLTVLLSCSARTSAEEDEASPVRARWRRPEHASGHRTPRSWRASRTH
ncbi:acyl-CoA carboxylase subunit epsilon [Streptomyces sp. Ru72]|uniref:acyl-CoA carboxylase subunit epsilon n=1 Tax=Streptomyces sp. Ru72 TaxID=2080747 RepID=UPI000CDD477B|nr:acyl-CoA carboxylase subunit epsilon [Streptomyces sp. Ru72]POX46537.1 hypothetical protein C3488_26265 [Streptomyces sp. Ru72]